MIFLVIYVVLIGSCHAKRLSFYIHSSVYDKRSVILTKGKVMEIFQFYREGLIRA